MNFAVLSQMSWISVPKSLDVFMRLKMKAKKDLCVAFNIFSKMI